MKKILAFGTSLSSTSINQKLVDYVASIADNVETKVVKLPDFYPMAMFGTQDHMPTTAQEFHDLSKEFDGFIISLAEHNGTYTAAFKNLLDWVSTIGNQDGVFHKKPVLIMGTAPGPKGAQFVINAAAQRFPWSGASEVFTYSLPQFNENFSAEDGITNEEKLNELKATLQDFTNKL